MEEKNPCRNVCIVGFGYFGYPLAEAFFANVPTIGFDIDEEKIRLIQQRPKTRSR